ncbi:hypothetical protein [Paenibacillus polymyxa]|uniref:hypothetical protein n=1 Tax=Paenibacillus polymyxa TaxID=1406 RepID=UPI00178196DD|nr:hypothetical protein [Paenibacillus polymyxa]QOH62424.1 hypothetical protein DI243_13965 [Paenibacillus polymyxa]
MSKQKIDTCKMHIKDLEEKLKKIYTVDVLKAGKAEDMLNCDVREALDTNNFLESIYSNLEAKGVAEGDTYDKYNSYLINVRNGKTEIKNVISRIEQENAAEIKNITILLEAFKSELRLWGNVTPKGTHCGAFSFAFIRQNMSRFEHSFCYTSKLPK